jgi:hypothetical protein
MLPTVLVRGEFLENLINMHAALMFKEQLAEKAAAGISKISLGAHK